MDKEISTRKNELEVNNILFLSKNRLQILVS
jgi:hypothetical protein